MRADQAKRGTDERRSRRLQPSEDEEAAEKQDAENSRDVEAGLSQDTASPFATLSSGPQKLLEEADRRV